MSNEKCVTGWHFDGSGGGNNGQNRGYITQLVEKPPENMLGKGYIFSKLMISASRKYILLQTYFKKIFQEVELYNPRFANFCHLQNHQNASLLRKWKLPPWVQSHLFWSRNSRKEKGTRHSRNFEKSNTAWNWWTQEEHRDHETVFGLMKLMNG